MFFIEHSNVVGVETCKITKDLTNKAMEKHGIWSLAFHPINPMKPKFHKMVI